MENESRFSRRSESDEFKLSVFHLIFLMSKSSLSVKVQSITISGLHLNKAQPLEMRLTYGEDRHRAGAIFRFSNRKKVNRNWSFPYNPNEPHYLRFHLSKLELLSTQSPLATGKLHIAGFTPGSATELELRLSHQCDPYYISTYITVQPCADQQKPHQRKHRRNRRHRQRRPRRNAIRSNNSQNDIRC